MNEGERKKKILSVILKAYKSDASMVCAREREGGGGVREGC